MPAPPVPANRDSGAFGVVKRPRRIRPKKTISLSPEAHARLEALGTGSSGAQAARVDALVTRGVVLDPLEYDAIEGLAAAEGRELDDLAGEAVRGRRTSR